ncbi:hypothetical protein NLM27_14960 [Bradyrhizobium sp. CCGB12]|uniref:hypothetical protein n=1 Tax=Bradyrhizobium sp. CCGB12 TaxID=2949632 RepID=UPI0020B23F55|nr:hypothetical protein [Bradyrhizobium sp. CCGB12]MCP3390077.1 hypothetical protein [Bradyrhizobium sp. CCGB12]
MPEFGRRQGRETGDLTRAETSDVMKWVTSSVVVVLLIAGFFGYRVFLYPANSDPLLEKRESFAEWVQRGAFREDPLQEHPSLNTSVVPIPFGNKVYKVPRNYLVDLDRSSVAPDPRTTTFEIRVLLPDLAPRNANNADRFVEHPYRDGFQDQVIATIRGGQEELDLSERKLLWDRRCQEKGRGTFRAVASGYKLCEADSDLFLKDTADGPLIFACNNISDKNPYCTLAEPTGAQYGVLNLEFSRDYVYQAGEIRKGFRSLLDSFAEN